MIKTAALVIGIILAGCAKETVDIISMDEFGEKASAKGYTVMKAEDYKNGDALVRSAAAMDSKTGMTILYFSFGSLSDAQSYIEECGKQDGAKTLETTADNHTRVQYNGAAGSCMASQIDNTVIEACTSYDEADLSVILEDFGY